MKKLILLTALVAILVFSSPDVMAQPCSDLFFSEYVEGYANNKALEIYNPTQEAINLSEYSLVRFRNGATDAPATTNPKSVTPLPEYMLQPDESYVVVLDRTLVTPETVFSSFDKPGHGEPFFQKFFIPDPHSTHCNKRNLHFSSGSF